MFSKPLSWIICFFLVYAEPPGAILSPGTRLPHFNSAFSQEIFMQHGLMEPMPSFPAPLLAADLPAKLWREAGRYFEKDEPDPFWRMQAVMGLAALLEAKDPNTFKHSGRVARMMAEIGRALGWSESKIQTAQYAAWLHDIGKVFIDDALLVKKNLTLEDKEKMRTHVTWGYDLLRRIPFLIDTAAAVRDHHERWDGQGYPRGLKAEDIHQVARVLDLVDSLDVMMCDFTERPYKNIGADKSYEEAFEEARKGSGGQFDPSLVEPVIQTYKNAMLDLNNLPGPDAANAKYLAALGISTENDRVSLRNLRHWVSHADLLHTAS